MKLTPEQRQQIIAAIKTGNINTLKSHEKVKSGKKVVFNNWLDIWKFHFLTESAQIERAEREKREGEIEVDFAEPFKSQLIQFFSKPSMKEWLDNKKPTNPIK